MPGIRSTLPPAFLLSLISLTCMAQEASRPARGVMPNGSYSVSDIENISLQNGNVNINIPLASLPPIAGGKLSWTISANYNSKLWNVTRYQQNDDPLTWAPYTIDTPGVDGGWTIGGTYSFIFRNVNEDLARIFYNGNSGLPQYELDWINNTQWWKVVLRMPDGSEHEFRPLDGGGYPGTAADFLHGFFDSKPNGTAKRYYSVDGAFMFARITNINDWTVYMLDGTQIIQTTDGVQRVQDTNGNKIKIFSDSYGTHYQDEQTARELRLVYNPAGQGQYQVWYNTVGGVTQHIDINLGTTSVQGKLYSVNNPPCDFKNEVLSAAFQVVREIVFPQTEPNQPQRRFTFSYNSDTSSVVTDVAQWSCPDPATNYTRTVSYGLGELSKIVTPSGSEVNYTYSHDGVTSFSQFVSADTITQDTVVEKKINHDGTFDKWTYAIAQSVGSGSVTGPDDAVSSEFAYNSILNNPGYSTDKLGLVYRSIRPFTKTERHWINLTFSGADITAQNGNTITLNPVVDKEYTTLTDASGANLKMSARVFSYDYNGNLVQETHYDWFDPALVSRDVAGVPTGVPASATVLKVITNSHYNQASSSTSANVYAKRSIPPGTPLILNAPRTTAVGSSSVRFSYDGQAFDVAPTVGNLTAKSVWVDLESKWITTSNTYDTYGNVATSTDARGKITQFAYGDNSHALPTSVTVDPQNGSGTQTTTTAYDFSTGLVTSQTDANGQQTTIDYTNQLLGSVDPFGRPGITKAPVITIGGNSHRRHVTTKYLDSARQVIVASDLNAENDQLLKTRTTTDMLGRPTLTESTEDGTNYTIAVRNAYLNMGQVTLTSSPMRSAAAATDSWARATKDKAGRVTELATFGGAAQPAWTGTAGTLTGAVTTAYSANFTTVTDQAGKVRRSMSDALGRLVRVDEPDASGNLGSTTSPNQSTSYGYSVLDNLTTVTQGSQARTFTYDSLSRLRTAVNPESGSITYQYDDNGNLLVKTDARSVSAHYEYDALNRATRRWYNGSSSLSQVTHDSPALPSGVGLTEEVKFYYDAQPDIGGPSYTTGPLKGRLVAQTYGSGTTGDYFGYDVLGRPKVKIQRTGAKDYDMNVDYSLSGAVNSLTCPSGRTISNTYDQVGRLTGLSGTLGDGTTRTYATNINYSSLGGMLKEQFGTNTPVYHKLHYNSRAQICDIRASNVNDDWGGELGALVNYYSTPYAVCGNGPDNNGNLLMSQTIINSFYIEDRYTYDSLNRLKSVGEFQNGVTNTGNQTYDYDRWGNRISLTASGTGINNTSFEIESATNRIYAPGDLALSPTSRRIQYDTAGNQKQDTYTGAGTRTYDAENKLTSAAANNNQTATYVYDASGQRIKRTANGVETWQVYGFGGELLAEYPANGDKLSPQKEYGYRNGELLVTAEPSTRTNVALAANGGVASASSTYACCGWNFTPAGANNGNRSGVGWGSGEGWNDNPPANTFPDWLQIDFNGSKTIDEIDVFTGQDNWQYPSEPTEAMTFSLYGLTGFDVQYWNGSSWTTVTGGSVTGNNKVWRKFTFTPVTTTKIRVLTNASVDGYSRITELEAWAVPPHTNVASTSAGGSASASSSYSCCGFNFTPAGANNGNRSGAGWGSGEGWNDNPPANTFPDWLQIDFNGSKMIDEIDMFTGQDNWQYPSEPTEAMTFSLYGLTGFDVQYWNGSGWTTVSGGSVTGNNKVWRKFTFAPITTSKIRVLTNASVDGYSRLTEVEAWGYAASTSATIQWLVTDHLGTPRMIIDQSGTLANVKRHDYLPFGEELFAPAGGRSASLGYTIGDGVRQQFTLKERDIETGLDYFLARYYSSNQGRFTSADELVSGSNPVAYADLRYPESLNKYHYVNNNPLITTDPDGHCPENKPCPYTTREPNVKTDPLKQDEIAVRVQDYAMGQAKSAANLGIGILNFSGSYFGAQPIKPYEPSSEVEAASMHIADVGALVVSAIEGRGPANVITAESKQTTVVTGEVGNSAKTSTLSPGPFATESIPARGPQRSFRVSERNAINEIGLKSGCQTCGTTNPGTRSGNFIPDHQPPNALNLTNGLQRLFPHCNSCSLRQAGEVTTAKRFNPGGHKF